MTMDAFELLGIPRRLAVSEDEVRTAFREAGKRLHPDAGGTDAEFARLQQAFATLASPSKRLKHWLFLQGAAGDDRGTISTGLMDLFGTVGETLQQADALIRKRDETRSALGLAMLEGAAQSCREMVERSIFAVDAALVAETAAFPGIESGSIPTDEAARHARNLTFLEKWRANLQERFARLV